MRSRLIISLLIAIFLQLLPSHADAVDPATALPAPSCGAGWVLDGKIALYDRETLSDRINGESELYFPYGFDVLAYGRYVQGNEAFDLDVYRLGSLLDAFGMFANYRPKEADAIAVGDGGAVTPAQLFFYQNRYFVRIQSTGSGDAGMDALAACARAVSTKLPAGSGRPRELDLIAIPEVTKGSVRYSAASLLGYEFFRRGISADVVIAGADAKLFVVTEESAEKALTALSSYQRYLRENGGKSGSASLTGIDPLYGAVLVEQAGRYVFGFVRVKDAAAALPVMEKVRRRLGN